MSSKSQLAILAALLGTALWSLLKETYLAVAAEAAIEQFAHAIGVERGTVIAATVPYIAALAITYVLATVAFNIGVRDRTKRPVAMVDARKAFYAVLEDKKWLKKNTETDPEKRQHLRFDYLKVRLANQIHNALAQGELVAWGEMNLSHGTGPLAPIPADKWHEIVIDFSNPPDQFRNMAIKRSGGHMAYVDIKLSSIEFAKLFHVNRKKLS